jgi:hypothetical protein
MQAGTFTSIATDTARPSPRSPSRTPRPSRLLLVLGLLSMTATLAGCAGTRLPASVKGGECRVFERPEFVVLGKRQYDQRWIDGNVEAGVGGCGWQRPAKRPPALDAAPSGRPLVVVPQRRASLMSRTFGHIRKRVPPLPRARPGSVEPAPFEAPRPANIVVPDVLAVPDPEPEAAPPPPPRAPVDELLSPTAPATAEPPARKRPCRFGVFCR